MRDSLGVYISAPFCRAKCTYCNFASGVFGAERMDAYVDRVCAEVRGVRARVAEFGLEGVELPERVDTIYLGGGTPSLLSAEQMRRLFAAVKGEFEVSAGAEVTLECAPGQLSEETLDEMLRLGMNRVSLGVQTFVDAEARAVGRLHTRAMCVEEIERLRAAGVGNINVDLIAGLPGQTEASWRESVDAALGTGVPHVSVYMLEVDEGSRLGREMLKAGNRGQGTGNRAKYGADAVPDDDAIADWYMAGCEWLEAGGVKQYEISNFAREMSRVPRKGNDGDSDPLGQNDGSKGVNVVLDFRSRHNVKYWRREPYVGFGLDAHSMLRRGVGGVRWANGDELDGYLGGEQGTGNREQVIGVSSQLSVVSGRAAVLGSGGGTGVEAVGMEQAFEEGWFLGLRMNEGVDVEEMRAEFGEGLVRGAMEALGEAMEAGLAVREGPRVRLTARGRTVSNEVFGRLLVGATA